MRFDDFVHNHAIRADDDAHDLVLGDQDEIHAADRELKQCRHEDHAHLIAEIGQQARGRLQNFVDLVRVADLIVDRLAFARAQGAGSHQIIDEEAVSAVGRHPAGRGMRLLEISEVFEVGHDVAEAGRRQAKTSRSRQ